MRSMMSTVSTEQVELMPAERADMAQASNPATTNPLNPTGSPTMMN